MTDKRTAVVVATHVELIERLVGEAGIEVIGAAETAFNGERLLGHFRPDVLVIENDLPGEQGIDQLPGLLRHSPDTKAVVVVNEHWTPRDTGSFGAVAVVALDRINDLVGMLADLDQWISAHADDGGRHERRTGRDRRLLQDWNKVGWDRRELQRRCTPVPA